MFLAMEDSRCSFELLSVKKSKTKGWAVDMLVRDGLFGGSKDFLDYDSMHRSLFEPCVHEAAELLVLV